MLDEVETWANESKRVKKQRKQCTESKKRVYGRGDRVEGRVACGRQVGKVELVISWRANDMLLLHRCIRHCAKVYWEFEYWVFSLYTPPDT